MKNRNLPPALLAILSAVFLYLSFPNCFRVFGFPFVAWIFAVPLFFALENKTLKERLILGIVFGVCSYSLLVNWLFPLTKVGFFSFVLVLSIQPILFCLFSAIPLLTFSLPIGGKSIMGRAQKLLYLPALWVGCEFLRTLFLGGFSWSIGYSQSLNLYPLQIANLAGSYGISFVLIFVNVCLYHILKREEKRFHSLCILGMLTAVFLYGMVSVNFVKKDPNNALGLDVCLIQPNIETEIKWDEDALKKIVKKNISLGKECLKESKAKIVIWPETAVPADPFEDVKILEVIQDFVREEEVYLLTGAQLQEQGKFYNSAILFDPSGKAVDIYRKKQLIPFSEYLPWRQYLGSLRRDFRFQIDIYSAGKTLGVFQYPLGEQRMGVIICSEDHYPTLLRNLGEKDIHYVVAILNDAWFAQEATLIMHTQATIMRAVESGISIVRVANTGWSCLINQYGDIEFESKDLSLNQEIDKVVFCPTSSRKTLYSKFGDVFSVGCLIFVIINTIVYIRRKR